MKDLFLVQVKCYNCNGSVVYGGFCFLSVSSSALDVIAPNILLEFWRVEQQMSNMIRCFYGSALDLPQYTVIMPLSVERPVALLCDRRSSTTASTILSSWKL